MSVLLLAVAAFGIGGYYGVSPAPWARVAGAQGSARGAQVARARAIYTSTAAYEAPCTLRGGVRARAELCLCCVALFLWHVTKNSIFL